MPLCHTLPTPAQQQQSIAYPSYGLQVSHHGSHCEGSPPLTQTQLKTPTVPTATQLLLLDEPSHSCLVCLSICFCRCVCNNQQQPHAHQSAVVGQHNASNWQLQCTVQRPPKGMRRSPPPPPTTHALAHILLPHALTFFKLSRNVSTTRVTKVLRWKAVGLSKCFVFDKLKKFKHVKIPNFQVGIERCAEL